MVHISTCRAVAILGLLAIITTSVSAAFSAEDLQRYDGVAVFTRQSKAHSFEMSIEVTNKVKDEFRSGLRSWSTDAVSNQAHPRRLLQNQSTIILQTCAESNCVSCNPFNKTFEDNLCLMVDGTNCIIIQDLANAHIHYWDGEYCSGNESAYYGCGSAPSIYAPGTNSVGFQVGC